MTRISLSEQYDNKDVIQQIYGMRDLVASGTYKSVSVADGTDTDAGKYIFTFTDQDDTAHTFKVSAKQISNISSSQSGSVVTVTFTFNDSTTEQITFSSVSGAMTLDTVQTVTAQKTFQDDVMMADVSMTSLNVSADTDIGGDLQVNGQAQIGENLAVEDSTDDSVLSCTGIVKINATDHVEATNRAYASAGSSDVLVKAHVPDMPVVHLTGAEEIDGQKTFKLYQGATLLQDTNSLKIKDKYSSDIINNPTTYYGFAIVKWLDGQGNIVAGLRAAHLANGHNALMATLRNSDGTVKNVTLAESD